MQPSRLDHDSLAAGISDLCRTDPDLARIHAELGTPPLWAREPGFPTLVHIILEQQVSLASAGAAFSRLQGALQIVTPETFLTLDGDALKRIGFSRQKAGYSRGLARALLNHELDLLSLQSLDDAAARAALIKMKGIGPWTADIYLLMAMLRPDTWPAGDLALAAALQRIKRLPIRPTPAEMEEIAFAWRPWRAIAARLLWQYYLSW